MKLTHITSLVLLCVAFVACNKTKPETFADDPIGVRIFTLDNGLKVYTSVNHDQPRIQAYICVKAGSKNDPLATTGLAHYLEHLMFKGTEHFGTINYENERPMLDSIEALYEVYKETTDSAQRRAIYHEIDSIGYEASKLAIPNEYDKLMASIGAEECNAFTSYDQTCYVENIPSNQLENWLKIQADRLKYPVFRGFHTELETVYEEYNMYASEDGEKASVALMSSLFPGHPYGRDVIGLPEHLKNPSITNVKNFYRQWYVPNNMAIVLSGDFEPDEAVAVVKKYLGDLERKDSLPELKYTVPEKPAVRDTSVYGLESEYVVMGWRLPGATSPEAKQLEMLAEILSNGSTGLFDVDLNQRQLVNGSEAGANLLNDYGLMEVIAQPKDGQSLEKLHDLILKEMKKLREGDFSEEMLKGIINNYKLSLVKQAESYEACAMMMLRSFCSNVEWSEQLRQLNELSKLSKKDIQALAQKYLKDEACVTVYKRQRDESNQQRIEKPQLTPIEANRDTASRFLLDIQQTQVIPVEPHFLDFDKDLSITELQPGQQLLYKQNTTNQRFSLAYVIDMGTNQDKTLSLASTYLDYLGTSKRSAEEVKEAFYQLACEMNVRVTARRIYITLEGLDENMDEAVALLEQQITDAKPDKQVYTNLVGDIIKNRRDAKRSKDNVSTMLRTYMQYGAKNPLTNILSDEQLRKMNPQQLVDCLHGLFAYKHRVLYYGPREMSDFESSIRELHPVAAKLRDVPTEGNYDVRDVDSAHVWLVDYDDNQSYLCMYSCIGNTFDVKDKAIRDAYDNYFGYGSMNCIVFQELRERRSLAYSAGSYTSELNYRGDRVFFLAHIGTQTDKLMDATEAFTKIIQEMPRSKSAFAIAKEALLTGFRTARTTKEQVLWSYLNAQDLGIEKDMKEELYEVTQALTLNDIVKYQETNVKSCTFDYGVVARRSDLDEQALSQYGEVKWLTLKDIFGY